MLADILKKNNVDTSGMRFDSNVDIIIILIFCIFSKGSLVFSNIDTLYCNPGSLNFTHMIETLN